MIGRTIEGRYRIDELVAMGGMGAVYRAAHLHMHKAVAIKVLHPEIEGFPELVMRFQREAVAGAHIVHPNVASASDFGTFDDESYYLVLEYIRGVTLSDVMKRGPVPPARAAKIAKQMAAALGAAHAKEIIHRDVKPRNIMLVEGQDDLVKLIDFGLAKVPVGKLVPVAQDEDISRRSLTAAGVVMGTVAYMAPETALGMRAVEPRSDLYAVGVILYEMLAGKHPFDAIEPGLLFAQHRNELPPPLRLRNPDVVVPDALEAVVRNLLEKDPQQRYPDAAAVVTALEEAMPGALAARERAVSQSRDLPVTVIGARSPSLPDTSEAEADAPPPRSSRAPSFSPSRPTDATVRRARPSSVPGRRSARDGAYTPRLLGRPGGDAGGTRGWRIAVGVLALVIVGLAAVIVVQREPELPAAGLGAAPAGAAAAAAATAAPRSTGTGTGTGAAATVAAAPIAPQPSAAPQSRAPSDGLRRTLIAAAASGDPAGPAALVELAETDPSAFRAEDVQRAAAKVAEAAGTAGGDDADRIYFALSSKLGADGLDVLYELYAAGGLSRGAARAAAVLSRPETLERATPQMRAAFELRRAACQHRPFMFARVGKEGDARALAVLESMLPPQCTPLTGTCCYKRHGELEKAVAAIRERVPAP